MKKTTIASGTGIATQAAANFHKPGAVNVSQKIQSAMEAAITQAVKDGVTDPAAIKIRIQVARAAAARP